jgi:ppGpp synthetase/RelA/SpoT-type nucleotidyltranferase
MIGGMAGVVEVASRNQINKAGRGLSKLRERLRTREISSSDLSRSEWAAIGVDIAVVEGWRKLHAYPLQMTAANLRHYVRDEAGGGARVDVTQRLKKFSTILDKLRREPTMQLTLMEDIGGVRAVLPSQEAADAVARRLRKNWKVHRYRDYVRDPKPSGYRALHLIVLKRDVKIEVQLRTVLQDVWANQIERDSRLLRTDYKSGAGERSLHDYYVAISELLKMRESGEVPSVAFMESVISRYNLAKPFLSPPREEDA